ncbi:cobalamin biosynthesis protein [Nocardia bovistercoris]|uniref:cobalamin biosynthesis protein n=1 Tax=Nocardia bovistercoris TaxID=2785916 RepID=UPI002FCD26CE
MSEIDPAGTARDVATTRVSSTDVLAVGLGLRPGVSAERVVRAVREVLGECVIGCLATIDRRAGEEGLRSAAVALGVPLLGWTAEQLAKVDVPHPGARTAAVVGTPSVAEAAAVLAAHGGPIVLPKRVVDGIVVAAAVRGHGATEVQSANPVGS